jgi:hypothetical protein
LSAKKSAGLQPRKGLERKYRKSPPNIRTRKRVDEPIWHGVAPTNAVVCKKSGAALAAAARARALADWSGKPGFRPRRTGGSMWPEMRPNFQKNLRNVKLLLVPYEGEA